MKTKETPAENLGEFFRGKRTLVTGGLGFVGSHLTQQLLHYGAHVTVWDKKERQGLPSLIHDLQHTSARQIAFEPVDLTHAQEVFDKMTAARFDQIFHFAAFATVIEKAARSPHDAIRSNTMGLVNLLEAVRLAQWRPEMIFFASTDKVYGEMERGAAAYEEEKTPLRGIGVYDAAKLSADIFARMYHEAFGLPIVILRICNLFGPCDFNVDYRLIPKALRSIFGNDPPQAPELYADAVEHTRDYLYVDDAVRAILLLAHEPNCRGEVFNLKAACYMGTPQVLEAVVATAVEIERRYDLKRAEQIRHNGVSIRLKAYDPNVVTIKKQHLDGGKITQAVGFEPQVGFQEGLRRTVEFYRNYFLAHGKMRHGVGS